MLGFIGLEKGEMAVMSIHTWRNKFSWWFAPKDETKRLCERWRLNLSLPQIKDQHYTLSPRERDKPTRRSIITIRVRSWPRASKSPFSSVTDAQIYLGHWLYIKILTTTGYDVFFDYLSIESGDFEKIIIENIKARAHFIVIFTPSALEQM